MPLGAARTAYFYKPAASGPSRTAIVVTAYGDAQIDTTQSKFGGASGFFDGAGDYLSAAGPNMGSGEFTMECWVRKGDTSGVEVIYDDRNASTNYAGDALWYFNGTALYWYSNGGNRINASSAVTSSATWYHLAVSRDSSNNIRMFVNGTQVGSTYTDSSTYTQPDSTGFIGMNHNAPGNHYLNGWIDEFRISTTARYTGSFTPSTSEFTNDANTIMLLHMNGADGSTTFTDDNS